MNKFPSEPSKILHITTDALTAEHLDNSLEGGVFLAWQDALYEGPVNQKLNLTELSRKRAQYFADAGWVDRKEIAARYQSRNKLLFSYQKFDEVILWFDHDLNSQLQLFQLIDWFAQHKMDRTLLSLVSIERLAGISAYMGLSMLTKESIQLLKRKRSEVTLGQMQLSQRAWKALGSTNPNELMSLLSINTSIMPFMKNALLRFLKQFPSQANGLSQSEIHIANVLLQEKRDANDLYLAMQGKEGIPFMNRAIFAGCLQNMCEGAMPMVEQHVVRDDQDIEHVLEENEGEFEEVAVEQKVLLKLTLIGKQVLHNWVDWIQVNGIHRTLGGVSLSEGSLWRYDENKRKLTKTYV